VDLVGTIWIHIWFAHVTWSEINCDVHLCSSRFQSPLLRIVSDDGELLFARMWAVLFATRNLGVGLVLDDVVYGWSLMTL
jgi:hypothetical protein